MHHKFLSFERPTYMMGNPGIVVIVMYFLILLLFLYFRFRFAAIFSAKSGTFINVEVDLDVVTCKNCRVRCVDCYDSKNDTIRFLFYRFALVKPIRAMNGSFLGNKRADRNMCAFVYDALPVLRVEQRIAERSIVSNVVSQQEEVDQSSVNVRRGDFLQYATEFEGYFYDNLAKLATVSGSSYSVKRIRVAMNYAWKMFERRSFHAERIREEVRGLP